MHYDIFSHDYFVQFRFDLKYIERVKNGIIGQKNSYRIVNEVIKLSTYCFNAD